MAKKAIGILVGSARRGSFSRQVADILSSLLPDRFALVRVGIADLPMFNQDYDDDGTTPPEWTDFREKIAACDAFLFVTPEYNRSVTPLLKNALDIASRPPGKNVWSGKPGAIVGVSPGSLGAFGSVQHLRQTVGFLGVELLTQPEVYLSGIAGLLDDAGAITNERTLGFLKGFAEAFAAWVDRIA